MARSQMQADLPHQLPYPATDLDQTKPEGVQLHLARAAFDQLPPQSIHQPVSRGVQEQAELVGYETVAAQAIRFHVELEVLDPVLCLSWPGVELLERAFGSSFLVLTTKRVFVPFSIAVRPCR
jgi:hypothetical protein